MSQQNQQKPVTLLPKVQISPGELLDRITILEIKYQMLKVNSAKWLNVEKELNELREIEDTIKEECESKYTDFHDTWLTFRNTLLAINIDLWVLEEAIRIYNKAKQNCLEHNIDQVAGVAHKIHERNDNRYSIKREINKWLGSNIIEEKSYVD